MNDCSPEIMTAVPRFYQNLCKKLMQTLKKQQEQKSFSSANVKLGFKIKRKPLNLIEKIQDRILDMVEGKLKLNLVDP